MRARIVAVMVTTVALMGAPHAHAAAAPSTPAPAIELLVDTSGSMNDNDQGGKIKKIDGAKIALLDFIGEVERGTPVGLRTYPAGTGGGCDAGRVRQSIARLRPSTLSATVRGLRADGDTPTAEALGPAVAELRRAGGGTLVLVSDGLSTCADPCEAAKRLAGKGVDFQAITVGFRIDDQGRKELQCIADAFDGRYVDAQDSGDLADVVRDAGRTRLGVALPSKTLRVVADSAVSIQAQVSNDGIVAARDVLVRLRPKDLAQNPGVRSPVQRLGNLEHQGDTRSVAWTFRPGGALLPGPGGKRRMTFAVAASAANTDATTVRELQVTIVDATDAASAGPIVKNRKLAILGDSYSAGEGANDYFPETRTSSNHCHRSRLTYLMPVMRLPDERLRACSGAVLSDIFEPNAGNNVKAQRDQLSDLQNDGRVDGVVLTIAGNDTDFDTLAKSCLAAMEPCNEQVVTNFPAYLASRAVSSSGFAFGLDSAEDFFNTRVGNDAIQDDIVDALRRINSTLNNTTVYGRRRAIAPILVPAYPLIVPLTGRNCLPMLELLAPSEMEYATRFEVQLNAEVEAATLTARRDGIPVWFVPTTEEAFMPDHSLCDGDPYARALNSFDGVDPRDTGQDVLDNASQQELDDLLKTNKNGTIPKGKGSTTGSVKGGAAEAAALLAKAFVAGGLQEMAHPNVNGYSAESRAILRWSVSAEGRRAAAELEDFKPVELLPTWPAGDVDLGQIQGGQAPEIQGGTSYPLTEGGLQPGTELRVRVHSAVRVLASLIADGRGRVAARVDMPRGLTAGRHELELVGVRAGGRPYRKVVAVRVVRPFRWNANLTFGCLLGACLLAGAAALLVSRRQRAAG